jgi:hypothetical protein
LQIPSGDNQSLVLWARILYFLTTIIYYINVFF